MCKRGAKKGINEILQKYPAASEYLIFLLQDIQEAYGYISGENMEIVCEHINVPISRAYSVATFYKSFRLEPKGEHEIKVCLGTACHLKGGGRLAEELQRRIGVEPGCTSKDMRYTLETVNCVGACALSPVMIVDEKYHPNTNAKKIGKVLSEIDKEEIGGGGNSESCI
ncbi:MAG: NAD(P)H-dependent oxidoreductase subunit E [Deltaproteobacteria bacterium]|nr:NAD(P)H-dependent oxidoreductase subunit E [Deltaproteobacteria bacterium]